jgi:hypothetical protein
VWGSRNERRLLQISSPGRPGCRAYLIPVGSHICIFYNRRFFSSHSMRFFCSALACWSRKHGLIVMCLAIIFESFCHRSPTSEYPCTDGLSGIRRVCKGQSPACAWESDSTILTFGRILTWRFFMVCPSFLGVMVVAQIPVKIIKMTPGGGQIKRLMHMMPIV